MGQRLGQGDRVKGMSLRHCEDSFGGLDIAGSKVEAINFKPSYSITIQPPFLRAGGIFNSGAVVSVKKTIQPPFLRAVGPFNSRAVGSVTVPIQPPFLRAVGIFFHFRNRYIIRHQ